MATPIIYDDIAGVTRCSACSEPIHREWASIEEDHFASIRRLSVWCSFCGITRVEERVMPCVECTSCDMVGTA